MFNIYKEPLENPKVWVANNIQHVVTEVCATSMYTVGLDTLCNDQKWDRICKRLVSLIFHSNKNCSKSFTLSADGVLESTQYIHGLQHDINIAPWSLVPTILHEFYGSKCHQGTIHMLEAIRRS